jgi:hypothetical protein
MFLCLFCDLAIAHRTDERSNTFSVSRRQRMHRTRLSPCSWQVQKKYWETLFLQLEYTAPDLDADGSKFVADASGPNGPLAYAEPHSLTSGYSHRDTKAQGLGA